jgi:nucleotide-binding universal stress UspA family protein
MGKIRKILVGVDGSSTSYKAAEVALDLAIALNAEVTAVYVIPSPPADYGRFLDLSSLEINEEEVERKIMHEVRVMALSRGVRLKTKISKGRPSDVIVSLAEEEGYDLIVLGNTGLGGAYRRMMGSVASEVVNSTKKPVLLVK